MGFSLDGYVDVAERIAKFYEAHPSGSLTTEQMDLVDTQAGQFLFVHARAWRAPDDPFPGDGYAWEPVPGKTPYTKDSELMNAQTAAWGRAIVAVGILASSKIASRQEVQARQGDGSVNGSQAVSGPQNGSQAPPRLVDMLRGAIRSYDSKELADDGEFDRLVGAATSKAEKAALVESLEAALVEKGGDPLLVRERWQAIKDAS